MVSPSSGVSSMRNKWDVSVASPRKLFRALHDFLDEHGYVHEYEPLKAEPDAIGGMAIFRSELVGKSDLPRSNLAYVVLGILLLLTIVLIPMGMRFLGQSRYHIRTIAKIGMEGEAYLAKGGTQGTVQGEVLDVVSDARVTLDVTAGIAQGDYKILRPTEDKRELIRIAEEQQGLENALSELLLTIALPEVETSQ